MTNTQTTLEKRHELEQVELRHLQCKLAAGELLLPLCAELVSEEVSSNYAYYYRTLTRRAHFEQHSLADGLRFEEVDVALQGSFAHMATRLNSMPQQQEESVSYSFPLAA